jgi:ketosteroid isomerase-like protein
VTHVTAIAAFLAYIVEPEGRPMKTGCERGHLSKAIWGATVCGCFAVLLVASGCQKASAPAVDPKASEQAVKDADVAWSKAAEGHDLINVLAYYAGDAVVMPAHEAMLTNKADMLKSWTALLDKNNSISWKPVWVESAKSGDLVYVVGTYMRTMKVGKGKPVTDRGKYLEVWKKQDDGTWKVEADTWNSDLALPGAKRS